MSYELPFLIMFNSRMSPDELLAFLVERLPGASRVRFRSLRWSNNWIYVRNNEDHDESMTAEPKEGFLYYPYRIEISPIGEKKDIDHQVCTAKHLKELLESLGGDATICADFEELLEP